MKKYEAPLMSGGREEPGRVPPAGVVTSAAVGFTAGIVAGLGKKLFGDIVQVDGIPALEPCIS